MDHSKEVVLITGASNGIGKGLSLAYAKRGAKVIGCDIDEKNGRKLSKEANELSGTFLFYPCDVSNPQAISQLIKQLETDHQIPTILINNAGISEFKNIFESGVEDWDEIINTNLRSVFLFSKLTSSLWKGMQIKGRIINITSTRASMSEPNSEGYAASKGGIIALTHALAASLTSYDIRVNSISPGWIHTGDLSELRNVDHEQHLSNRVGRVEDIAKAAFYLADAENDFVNGENIVVDGGMTRKMIYEH
ncbi:SDR family NAD(P)-dependent oxidoreductase [Halobacillus salinus]|uniref:SDR family NAD(P)-dependent oxidoreductase n=1 Tax=Halobacillus salinus TaxID=192814 RepID=UPI0009A7AB86|nr:SDR family oxidoreductase [Halobacillus salinus]